MKTFLIAYVATGLVFLCLDAIWLTVMSEHLYRPLLGDKLAPQFHIVPAAIFYLIFIAGLVLLAILPAVEIGSLGRAVVYGALVGLVGYATYDLTNQATLKDWPVLLTVADMAWGTVLSGAAAGAGFLAAARFAG